MRIINLQLLEGIHSLVQACKPLLDFNLLSDAGIFRTSPLGVCHVGLEDAIRISILVLFQRNPKPRLRLKKETLKTVVSYD